MKNKTRFKRFLYGIKLALNIPSLPVSVDKFHNYPLLRVFRVLGGISVLLVLSGSEVAKKSFLFYIVFPLAFLQFIYIIVINLVKFFFIIYLSRNNKFIVRNSPLNKLASFSVTLISCVIDTCVLGLSAGTALGLGLGIDELLSNYGRETVFRNTFGKGLDKALNGIGFENPNKDITNTNDNIETLKYKYIYKYKALKSLNKDIDELDSIGKQAGIKDSKLITEVKKDLKRIIELEKDSIIKSISNILSQLEKKR